MDLKALLNQALNSNLVQSGKQQAQSLAQDKSQLATLGAGVLGGGIIGLLMGSKKTKKLGKKALTIGGSAALGALAYKMYNDWQANQNESPQPATFDQSNPRHEILILKAMIASAKADGHVDEQEMAKINQVINEIGADNDVQTLFQQELKKPLDPNEIAALAQTPAQASEIYLASAIVADEQNFMEKAYLQELAKQLGLSGELVNNIHQQINGE
ncbi:tellurite resistance TerB family protein [Vibrio diazotrophicus]|uniref:tellurite resistance TerB family protein n=1 Tax=Vibrio diazotrophicus TaxID=685 RepID=UPI00142D34E6|nr:tellurite resistance TerB family protein [Vibrio diazotrophicus]NIY92546.1 tellurite resistance TerB family protein [Vibrio diazotrophicus]